jgi:hypothetical protein
LFPVFCGIPDEDTAIARGRPDPAHRLAVIEQCLDGLPAVHKGEMETLMTHKVQTFADGPFLAA